MAVGGDTSILDIEDLYNVKTELKEFNKPDWREFGSKAGLSYTTLNGIQANKTNVDDRFEECLACWLRRQDKVDEQGKPSRIRLAEILDEIGDRALADKIRDRKEVQSTGVKKVTNYAGLLYYEEKGAEELITFTAAKELDALLEFIKKEHPQAERGPHAYFRIASPDGYVELNLNAPQNEPFTGWSIKPHMTPCRLYQDDINNFGDEGYSLPPSCSISVYGSPGAVPTLNYSVPLVGVVRPVTLYIRRSLRTTNPTTSSSSSNVVHESTAAPEASTFKSDIAHRVMTECTGMIKDRVGLYPLIDRLVEKRMISDAEKGQIIDTSTGLTANQRMDKLLSLVKAAIREDGEDFSLFLEIIKQENTRRADKLAQALLDNYKRLI